MTNARYRRKQLAKRADWRGAPPTEPAAPRDAAPQPAVPADTPERSER